VLSHALLGRSHRSHEGREVLRRAIRETHDLLGLPENYRVAIVPGSDTGAFEAAMWSLLGARGVDVLAWEVFGKVWVGDIVRELKLADVRVLEAPFGELPDMSNVDFARDVVFTWNGTTSGVRVPNGDWIPEDRAGLTLIDATSAIFAQRIDWHKADVITYSWQKVLGGEAAHGMLILSPRAIERLESYVPPWPIPKLFRLTKEGRLDTAIFAGETINTPSMLCVADYLDALSWARSIGGLEELIARADRNAAIVIHGLRGRPGWRIWRVIRPHALTRPCVCELWMNVSRRPQLRRKANSCANWSVCSRPPALHSTSRPIATRHQVLEFGPARRWRRKMLKSSCHG
jgi:phosphoserine aminotransferase